MKVVITGSHFSPAYAVIKKSKWKITYIGRKYALTSTDKESYEYRLCREKGVPFLVLEVPRFSRVAPLKSFFSLASFYKSVRDARQMLKKINPDVVLSFGGYISVPVVIAAYLQKLPICIHEQTLDAGLANRIAAFFADKVFISFNSSKKYFPKDKTILSGNPIREDILNYEKKSDLVKTEKPIIYVTGGSTGSAAINDLLDKSLNRLGKYYVIHQRGVSKTEAPVEKDYLGKDYFTPQEVAWILRHASLIVSRSGINTITEILYFGVPAILIPLPYGQKNEQLKNARYAEKLSNVVYFKQDKINPAILISSINNMTRKNSRKTKNEKTSLRHKEAADIIINETEKLSKKQK